MQKTGTLTFKLAKLMIAISWADGKIENPEVNALKEALFSLPELDAREWAELEIYMDSPVDESEREILLDDVLAALRSTSEKTIPVWSFILFINQVTDFFQFRRRKLFMFDKMRNQSFR